ncbi:hypothetical protein [Novosphingobium gossypii]|uniref:hypothetical protein n=1 Tax=Novosphingobium gossypii TaxID=1604774 RepID=UPI003D1B62A5
MNEKVVNNPRQVLAPAHGAAQRNPMTNPHKDRVGAAPPAPTAPTPLALSLLALDRIEAALSRIEGAAPACVARDGDLRRRHDALKASVAQSLAGLDELLAVAARPEQAPEEDI